MECFTVPARIEFYNCISGINMCISKYPMDEMITWKLLPNQLIWINTQGVRFHSKMGFKSNTYVIQVSKQTILAKNSCIDGPYLSKEHMEECSPMYNLIIVSNPLKASNIVLRKIKKEAMLKSLFDDDFIDLLPLILEHTVTGKIINDSLTGVHYLTSDLILKILPSGGKLNRQHSYYCIEKVDPVTGIKSKKKAATTFWPVDWTIEHIVVECAIAWNNKIPNENSENYTGYTSCKLKIIFCFKNGKFRTVYPEIGNRI